MKSVESGLVPASDGWFVVSVREAAWLTNEAFGARCVFEADVPVVRRSDIQPSKFTDLGIKVAVLYPGRPSGLYHADSRQEDFLVLSGECLALVEGEERQLRAWDYLHCAPGTAHCFVGTGDEPCVLLMVGSRLGERRVVYPASKLAQEQGAGVERETGSADEAYASFPHWQPGRPTEWDQLPWA
jgi:uncharacterized cupin superfamily protein